MPTPTPSPPSPRTWALDDLVLIPRLRADVENAVAFLGQKPLFVGQNNNGGSIASNTDTAVALFVENTDNWNGHVTLNTNGAIPSQYWAPVPGWYLCRNTQVFATAAGAIPMAAGFAGITGGAAFGPVRGALIIGGASTAYAAQCTDLIQQVNASAPGGSGDYIQPTAWQNSGGALTLNNGSLTLPTASVRWACALSGTEPLPVPPLASAPSPITSAWMNANVRDAIRFLAYPPACKAVYTPGSLTMANSSLTSPVVVPCGTAALDNYGGWNTSTFTYTAPVAGVYVLYGQFNIGSTATAAVYSAGLTVNGGTPQWGDSLTYAPSSSTVGGASVSRRLRLTAGQTVQLVGAQTSGVALTYSTATQNQTRFIALWDGI